ncbi:hypothetical protein ASD56_08635 [Microbacterium sp. Root166]|uniref:hypothetical protein n=1 Tax=Microbacterium sp. Root166 TaxID=1736478 RepID=UPI0006F37EC2|nr:hypothetical protein [Microbacterium sp. Root166]KQZ84077.1 hypothetical protein ASD56_08635 [Microbacterium sp. Root166]
MTAITASHSISVVTPFERTLLSASAHLDRFVATRLERRATAVPHIRAQVAAVQARTDAQARGAIGILPR